MTFLSSWTCPPGSSMCDSKSTCLTVNKICFLVRLSLPYFLVNGTTLSFWNSSYQSCIYSLLFASPFILIWLPFHNSECAYLLPIALHLFHSNGIGLTNNSFLESKMCLVYQDNWFPRFIFFWLLSRIKKSMVWNMVFKFLQFPWSPGLSATSVLWIFNSELFLYTQPTLFKKSISICWLDSLKATQCRWTFKVHSVILCVTLSPFPDSYYKILLLNLSWYLHPQYNLDFYFP